MGLDPATLEVTVGQIMASPELAHNGDDSDSAARFEFSSAEGLADQWRAIKEQGVVRLIVWPQPFDRERLQFVTAALRNYRAGSGQ